MRSQSGLMVRLQKHRLAAMVGLGMLAAIGTASASSVNVYVGYADGLRGVGFFPSPWHGDPDVVFIGETAAGPDAGAIRIDNTSGVSISIDKIKVSMFDGTVYDLWGTPGTLLPGQKLIVTETAHYNFDTSENTSTACCTPWPDGETAHAPHVDITIDGTTYNYLDSGHILDTGGFDYASVGNESFQWRPIGTSGITDPGGTKVPESTGVEIALLGIVALAGFERVNRTQSRA